MVANKYAFLQITRRRFLNEWEAFKKVISRRNIRRRITIPLTLSNLKLLRRIARTENILHRNVTPRQVARQNRGASNTGISQSACSVKVLNLFSRSRRKTNKRKSKHSAMLRNKETRHRMFIGLLNTTRKLVFFFNDTATTEIYTLSLHDALPISPRRCEPWWAPRSRAGAASSSRSASRCRPDAMDIIGLCGSLRRHSLNRLLLELAGECLPPQATMQVCDWRALPPLDADLLATGMPASVHQLRERIRRADAVVLATPEYNFSIPGMFKNALDWISRGDDQPFRHKPVALVSASPGPLGGARVQYELRKVLQCMEADVLARPEVFVG